MQKKKNEGTKCYYCEQAIKFDPKKRSDSGKAIPLNMDGTPHDCPESPYNKRKREQEKDAAKDGKQENDEQKTAITG